MLRACRQAANANAMSSNDLQTQSSTIPGYANAATIVANASWGSNASCVNSRRCVSTVYSIYSIYCVLCTVFTVFTVCCVQYLQYLLCAVYSFYSILQEHLCPAGEHSHHVERKQSHHCLSLYLRLTSTAWWGSALYGRDQHPFVGARSCCHACWWLQA